MPCDATRGSSTTANRIGAVRRNTSQPASACFMSQPGSSVDTAWPCAPTMAGRKGPALFRYGRLIVPVVAVTIALPLATLAQGTPETTPATGCPFPPISIELLRKIRDGVAENPPPTPTTAADGYSSSRTHLIQFPPPRRAARCCDSRVDRDIPRCLRDVPGSWRYPDDLWRLDRGFHPSHDRRQSRVRRSFDLGYGVG